MSSTTKSARELAKKTSDAHSPVSKKTKETTLAELATKQEPEAATASASSAEPLSMSQILATLRNEMSDTKTLVRDELVEVRESIGGVYKRIEDMQASVDRAFAPIVERVEEHDTTLVEHTELLKAAEHRFEAQQTAMEQPRLDILELRTAQSVAEATVKEVRQEMAMPPDAPPPPLPRASGGWDRVVEPQVLQANASALFSGEALAAALTPLAQAANIAPEDIEVKGPSGATVAKRWTLIVKGRDPRTAARRAAMLMGTLRDGNGWRRVEVESAAGEKVPLYIAPDKNPRAEDGSRRQKVHRRAQGSFPAGWVEVHPG